MYNPIQAGPSTTGWIYRHEFTQLNNSDNKSTVKWKFCATNSAATVCSVSLIKKHDHWFVAETRVDYVND